MADQLVESIGAGAKIGDSQSEQNTAARTVLAALVNLFRTFKKAWSDSSDTLASQMKTRTLHEFHADSDPRGFC